MSPLEALDTEDESQAPVPVGVLYLPPRLAQWGRYVIPAAAKHGISESLLFAVLDRESEGSEALRPKGAAGTGDWTARTGHWLREPHVRVVTELPPGWHAPKDHNGDVIPGPYAIPEDGQGWGRGLMQHDFESSLLFDWRDPAVNVDRGAKLLAELLAEFPRAPRSAIASYNCGPQRVRDAILAGLDVDRYTTGRDYSADVMRRAAGFRGESTS